VSGLSEQDVERLARAIGSVRTEHGGLANLSPELIAEGLAPVVAAIRAETVKRWTDACDDAGIPHTPEALIRHHRNSAAAVAQMDATGLQARIAALVKKWEPKGYLADAPDVIREVHALLAGSE
jgi:hypothetical protein